MSATLDGAEFGRGLGLVGTPRKGIRIEDGDGGVRCARNQRGQYLGDGRHPRAIGGFVPAYPAVTLRCKKTMIHRRFRCARECALDLRDEAGAVVAETVYLPLDDIDLVIDASSPAV